MSVLFAKIESLSSLGSFAVALLVLLLDGIYHYRQQKLAQPSSVATWLEDAKTDDARIVIRNNSALPVYDVVVTVVNAKGYVCSRGEELKGRSQFRKVLAIVPPGLYTVDIELTGFGGMNAAPVLEIGFTCADRRAWLRRGNGKLERLCSSAISHFGLGRPLEFASLHPYCCD